MTPRWTIRFPCFQMVLVRISFGHMGLLLVCAYHHLTGSSKHSQVGQKGNSRNCLSVTACNCSELMRDEQFAGLGEGIETFVLQVPKRDAKAILLVVPLFGSSSAADLAADDQMPQTPFGSVVLRRHVRVRYEDEQFPRIEYGAGF